MKLNQDGLLIVISGPSGVGKGTVRKALFDRIDHNLEYSVSMTTRKPREGEIDGSDYYFVSQSEFKEAIDNGDMLEYAEFVGNFYGTPLSKIKEKLKDGHEVVLEIETNGAIQVMEKIKDAVFIFIVPPNIEALENRIRKRATEPESVIQERLEKAKKEFNIAHKYDYIVVNDTVDNAADRIMAIIRAEHAKTKRSIHMYRELINSKG